MAVDFSGTSQAINVGNGSSLQITGAFCVMCWVNYDLMQNTDIVSKQTTAARGFSLQCDDDGGTKTYSKMVIATSISGTLSSGWPTNEVTYGKWHHIAGQFIPSTSVQIWQDGELGYEETSGVPAVMYDPSNNVIIAGRPDSSGYFDGKIADVRIYSRNLSANEIAAVHTCRGHDNILDGLISRWMMGEKGTGTVSGSNSVIDMGQNKNHGTPVGSPIYCGSTLSFKRRATYET